MCPFDVLSPPLDILPAPNKPDRLGRSTEGLLNHEAGISGDPIGSGYAISSDPDAYTAEMLIAPGRTTNERPKILSTGMAGPREFRFALLAVAISISVFVVAAPFAKMWLGAFPAFLPMYVSILVICDILTAILLFGQFRISRSRGLLMLASGYVFSASIAVSYAVMFPGLFSPTGLLGAGPQSTSAMYMFWHCGFPFMIIVYTQLKDNKSEASDEGRSAHRSAYRVILSCLAAVIAIVAGYTVLATAGHSYLPVFIQGDRTTGLGRVVLSSESMLCVIALVALWLRRPYRVIDLWLMVVCSAWFFDIALSAILNSGRYDVGWYVGRIYGLVAGSFLLAILIAENANYYTQLVRRSEELGFANTALERLSREDGLTGLANRRSFDAHLAGQIAIARRYRRNLALVLFDVDSFKTFNDHYGHPAGDECLRQVAVALQSCCRRPADMAARYGGEEFALILPDTGLKGAIEIAEAARNAVGRLGIPHAHTLATSHVSISGGVAVLLRTPDLTAQQLIAEADRTLYQAKHLGRNRTVSALAEFA